MRLKSIVFPVLLFVAAQHSALLAQQQQATVSEIKQSLVCMCDCSMTVEACQGSMACEVAEKLTAEAGQYVEQGMDKASVLSAFIKKYGEHILAAPTKRGFNLTAWILPFAAIILAGFGIVVALRRWAKQPAPTSRTKRKLDAANGKKSVYEEELDEVLRYLD